MPSCRSSRCNDDNAESAKKTHFLVPAVFCCSVAVLVSRLARRLVPTSNGLMILRHAVRSKSYLGVGALDIDGDGI